MAGRLQLIQGPAGAGKSQVARRELRSGRADVLADVTGLWAAVRGLERDMDGNYPLREDDDVGLQLSLYLQAVTVHQGLAEDRRVIVTSSRRGQELRWERIARSQGATFTVRTIDPGRRVSEQRLIRAGWRVQDVAKCVGRWYGRR